MPKNDNKRTKINNDTEALAKEVIKKLKEEKLDLSILEKMRLAFGSKSGQREAFINLLDKKLDNKQLHKLNNAVVENAANLIPNNDPNFVCRTTDDKIFQQLLLLEAKRCGMKAKFNNQNELQPLEVQDIPQEILNHYFILEQKFYPERDSKNPLDSRISQSINFLLYAPLFRESEIYETSESNAAKVEIEIQNLEGKFVKSLVEKKIATHLKEQINTKENLKNIKNEDKEAKIFSIIEESIEKLEKNKKIIVKEKQREKIKRHISKFLEEVSDEALASQKNDIIDIIYQGLYKNQSKWSKLVNRLGIKSYGISSKNLQRVGKVINSKIQNFYPGEMLKNNTSLQLEEISKKLRGSGTIIPLGDKYKQQAREQLKKNFDELKSLNLTLQSEVKKAKPNEKKKPPPIPPKPKHLIKK